VHRTAAAQEEHSVDAQYFATRSRLEADWRNLFGTVQVGEQNWSGLAAMCAAP
jgi:hypothetical protein